VPRFKVRIEGGDLKQAALALTRSGFIVYPDVEQELAVVGTIEADTPEDAERRVRKRLPEGDYTATYVASE
jgi:hypothetical protein